MHLLHCDGRACVLCVCCVFIFVFTCARTHVCMCVCVCSPAHIFVCVFFFFLRLCTLYLLCICFLFRNDINYAKYIVATTIIFALQLLYAALLSVNNYWWETRNQFILLYSSKSWFHAGQEPVAYVGPRKWSTAQRTHYAKLWNSSIGEAVKQEPYLAFSILFICLRIFMFFFPMCFALIKGFWTQYFQQINLGILAKLNQLLECVPHAVDVRKVWSKLRLVAGAKNARAWASSLASVSLGGQSSPRAAVGLMGSTF